MVAARGEQLRARLAEPVTGDGHARLAHVVTMLRAVPPIMPRTVPAAAGGFLALGLARRVAGPDLDAQAVHEVLRGLPHNVTTDMDLELWALATRLDQASTAALHAAPPAELAERFHARALPPVLQRELAAFLAEHGHRTAAEIDLGMPRWSDDPTQVLGSLANYLRITDPTDHPDARFARAAAAAEAAVARGRRARCGGARGSARGSPAWRCAARGSSRACARRTRTTSCACSPHARAQLAILGAELAGRGLLAAADDVFFLELREVAAALDGTDQRGRRRRSRAPSTTGSCAAATSRGCCCPTAPSRRPSTPRPRPRGRWSASRPRRAPSRASCGWCSTRRTPTWSRARSSSRRPPTPAGPRCSSPRAGS